VASHIGVRGFERREDHDLSSADFSIGESPIYGALTADHRGSEFRCLVARGPCCKPRDIARPDLPIREEQIGEEYPVGDEDSREELEGRCCSSGRG
jgi:hypothetical protein